MHSVSYKIAYVPSEVSDQPAQLVFAVRPKTLWILDYQQFSLWYLSLDPWLPTVFPMVSIFGSLITNSFPYGIYLWILDYQQFSLWYLSLDPWLPTVFPMISIFGSLITNSFPYDIHLWILDYQQFSLWYLSLVPKLPTVSLWYLWLDCTDAQLQFFFFFRALVALYVVFVFSWYVPQPFFFRCLGEAVFRDSGISWVFSLIFSLGTCAVF